MNSHPAFLWFLKVAVTAGTYCFLLTFTASAWYTGGHPHACTGTSYRLQTKGVGGSNFTPGHDYHKIGARVLNFYSCWLHLGA